ncbi:uncharacterized protein LOC115273337 [Suricata suricatta]|uniref:uncharacterized protein LOC115273337 n=1 Tax=Suricata suricatta TaxID=37032 RepID=UPI001155764F|nr:uncharacterized protein LOC115273337 [Suricata suricatta]
MGPCVPPLLLLMLRALLLAPASRPVTALSTRSRRVQGPGLPALPKRGGESGVALLRGTAQLLASLAAPHVASARALLSHSSLFSATSAPLPGALAQGPLLWELPREGPPSVAHVGADPSLGGGSRTAETLALGRAASQEGVEGVAEEDPGPRQGRASATRGTHARMAAELAGPCFQVEEAAAEEVRPSGQHRGPRGDGLAGQRRGGRLRDEESEMMLRSGRQLRFQKPWGEDRRRNWLHPLTCWL